MNTQIKSLGKNFSYTLLSNFISLIISSLIVLIVPKFIGIEEYGYFQLYIFYSTYTALLHFGWIDGIYLRFGGARYEELDKNIFFSQFWMLTLLQFVILLFTILISLFLMQDINDIFILRMMIVSSTIVIPKGFLQYVLQSTNRIKEYSHLIISEKIIFSLLTLIFIFRGTANYQTLIMIDIISKIFALACAIHYCRDIVIRSFKHFKIDLMEIRLNISVGINLLIAYITGSLIIGTVRFAIEKFWDVEIFGKVSLTLNISNLFMIFINSLSVILFPVLRRVEQRKLIDVYNSLRVILLNLSLGLLITYFPAQWLMKLWLPRYIDSLDYMLLLFPIMIFEGKMNLLINTYLKTLRKEKTILKINIITVCMSIILTILNIITIKNIHILVFSITFLLGFRSTVAEIFLAKKLNLKKFKNIFIEILFVLFFILLNMYMTFTHAMIMYIFFYACNIFIQKNNILISINKLKNF